MSDLRTAPESGAPALGVLLDASGRQAVDLVRTLPDASLTHRTPCADYDVRALVDHLFHVVVQFRELALKQPSDFSATPERVAVAADWREGFAAAVAELVGAWSLPGAEEGTTGALDMPARTVGCMALLDLTVHAWDLARALGVPYRPDPDGTGVVPVLERAVAELGPTARRMGMMGEPVAVPEGGGAFERLLAATGRDPRWAPPAQGSAGPAEA
ncbi:TIGR03086 family metal-binding protein [Streptomyces sp. NPDC127068]|uniref:TIGR03086 family metal-binding protein n=1 Tax=Streptomyces sp. NPDC127068 TaxID=3347127 RepID=UPI00365CEDCB